MFRHINTRSMIQNIIFTRCFSLRFTDALLAAALCHLGRIARTQQAYQEQCIHPVLPSGFTRPEGSGEKTERGVV